MFTVDFWLNPTFLTILFTILFICLYGFAWSVGLGLRDNYRRYAQKAELQWTGPRRGPVKPRPPAMLILLAAIITAVVVVQFIILG